MKAIIVQEKGRAEVTEIEIPKLRSDYVRVKVHSLALNPTDWMHIEFVADKGSKVGCDFSGTVEEIGEAVTLKVQKGDKIAGVVHGSNISNHQDGGFAEYLEVKDGCFIHVPDSLSMEDASTIGIGVITVGQGLYQSLKLPPPDKPTKKAFPLLIYGGSTATGTLAIQYAKLSGLTVVSTASKHNLELLTSLGADAVFDYNDPDCGDQIRKYTNNELHYVFDCIATESSTAICADAFSSNTAPSNEYSGLLKLTGFPRNDVNFRHTLMYTSFGETFSKGPGRDYPADPEHYEFAKYFWALTEKLIAEGKIKTHPSDVRDGGLQGIFDGLAELKAKKVSGKKVVYRL